MRREPALERTQSDSIVNRHESTFVLCIILAGAVAMFFLDALVDNSVVFHDGYVYKAAANLRLTQKSHHGTLY